jgi:hypothetical protein
MNGIFGVLTYSNLALATSLAASTPSSAADHGGFAAPSKIKSGGNAIISPKVYAGRNFVYNHWGCRKQKGLGLETPPLLAAMALFAAQS